MLYGIDPALQEAIYSDQVLGMDSVSKLHYWFKAYGTAPGSWSYDIIMENFKGKNVALTDVIMQQIIGTRTSMLSQILATVRRTLVFGA